MVTYMHFIMHFLMYFMKSLSVVHKIAPAHALNDTNLSLLVGKLMCKDADRGTVVRLSVMSYTHLSP